MFTRKKDVFRSCFLLLVSLLTVSACAQIVPTGVHLMTVASGAAIGSDEFDLHGLQTPVGANVEANNNGFNGRNALDPTPSRAANAAAIHNVVAGQAANPRLTTKGLTEAGTAPSPADNNLPPTLTVRTATLLELHEMRQSAVALCLQLPTKYRTRLPQCADIFKHEIRLTEIAKHKSQ